MIIRILYAALFLPDMFRVFRHLEDQFRALQEFLQFGPWFDEIGGRMSAQTDEVAANGSSS